MNKRSTYLRIDAILLVAILVLVNLISIRGFAKWDLTRNDAYSLSPISVETVAQIEDPLRVRVFYSAQVPAPYNGIRLYLLDLLREYQNEAGSLFSVEVIDVASPEGRLEAQNYGLQQVEIQEIRSDEFQSRAVFLGAVVLYGNVVERIDQITSTDGLEYRLTVAMQSAISQVDALAGTTEPVTLRTFVSPSVLELDIQGAREFSTMLAAIHERVNRDNYQRIAYELLEPSTRAEIDRLATTYALEGLRWESLAGGEERGLLEVVLTYRDQVEPVPIPIYTGLFGGYSLPSGEEIETAVRDSLRSLVNASPLVGYVDAGGTKDLNDYQLGSGPFRDLLAERLDVVAFDPTVTPIPAGIDTLILNGPTLELSEAALYRIDQFLLTGGSLFILIDGYIQEFPTQQEMMMGAQPTWRPNESNALGFLAHYGMTVGSEIVLDEESFVSQQGGRRQQLFQAPVLTGRSINRESPITAGLEDLIFLNAVAISADDGTTLLESSPRSWSVASPEEIGPWISGLPNEDRAEQFAFAAISEGEFESYFDGPVDLPFPQSENDSDQVSVQRDQTDPGSTLGRDVYRSASTEPGRILVVGSSALTTPQMLDPQNRTPNGTFLLNAVDYLNGTPGFAELRSKGLGVPRLDPVSGTVSTALRWINTVLAPTLVLLVGLVVLLRRRARSRRIKSLFASANGEVLK